MPGGAKPGEAALTQSQQALGSSTSARAHLSLGSGMGEVKFFPTLSVPRGGDVQVKPPFSRSLQVCLGINPMRPSALGQEISVEPGNQGLGEQWREINFPGGRESHLPFVCSYCWGHTATGVAPSVTPFLGRPWELFKLHQRKTSMRRVSSPPSKISDMWFF